MYVSVLYIVLIEVNYIVRIYIIMKTVYVMCIKAIKRIRTCCDVMLGELPMHVHITLNDFFQCVILFWS